MKKARAEVAKSVSSRSLDTPTILITPVTDPH